MITKSYFLSELERERYEKQVLLADGNQNPEEIVQLDDEELLKVYKQATGKQPLAG